MKDTMDTFSSDVFEKKYTVKDKQLGCVFNDNKVIFNVWAPTADSINLLIYIDGDVCKNEKPEKYTMNKNESGVWSIEFDRESVEEKYYTYEVSIGEIVNETCDPYAKAVGVNGNRGMILDLQNTNPEGWEKDENPFAGKSYTDAIIYEMHVRDFTIDSSVNSKYAGKYLGVCESGLTNKFGQHAGMDYLKELGITHVHLLPIADYATVDERTCEQYNWGYDPKNYNVPEGSYATDAYDGKVRIKEFKTMVQTLHKNGISVIMDVVYNHTFDTNFCFNKIVPGYFYRMKGDKYSDGSGCGNDVASERSMVRKFIVDSVAYWAKEYHIDGFRFDLMGLIDVDTMNEIRKAVDEINPEIIIYGEGWDLKTDTSKENVELAKQENTYKLNRIAMFNDDFRDAIKGNIFYDDVNGYISGNIKEIEDIYSGITASVNWASNPKDVVNFTSCHDNNTLFDKIEISNPGITLEEKIEQNKLAALIEFTSQGIILMHAGEEILRTKADEEGKFVEDSVRAGDFVNSIKWNDLGRKEYENVAEYYKGLIKFRKAHASLRMTEREMVDKSIEFVKQDEKAVIEFVIDGKYSKDISDSIIVVINPLKKEVNISLPEGDWELCADKEKVYNDQRKTVKNNIKVAPVSGVILSR